MSFYLFTAVNSINPRDGGGQKFNTLIDLHLTEFTCILNLTNSGNSLFIYSTLGRAEIYVCEFFKPTINIQGMFFVVITIHHRRWLTNSSGSLFMAS